MTPIKNTRSHLSWSLILVCCSCPLYAWGNEAAVTPPAAVAPAKPTHTLFMGVDLSVQRDGQLLPVRDVQGAYLVAKRKGKEIRVPTTGKSLQMKVNRSLKVSSRSAVLGKLSVDRGYTPANDPFKKFAASAGMAAGAEAATSLEQGEMFAALQNQDYTSIADARGAMFADVAGATQAANNATVEYSRAVGAADSQIVSTGSQASTLAGDEAKMAFDALVVEFDISSPEPLSQPYVVVLAQLRAGEASQAMRYNWVYAKAVGDLGEKPTHVYIKQGGFPAGFVIEQCSVHLFASGEEIPTDSSPMRAELTQEEAYQYAAIDYITQHKGATLPAGLASGQNTEALRAHLDRNYRGGPVFVEVSKLGLTGRIFRDKDAKQPLDDDNLAAIIRDLRFNPALSVGKAVDSVVGVKASPDTV